MRPGAAGGGIGAAVAYASAVTKQIDWSSVMLYGIAIYAMPFDPIPVHHGQGHSLRSHPSS